MNNLRLVRENSKIFSLLFFSNFSAPKASRPILKKIFPLILENHENCIFCIDTQKSLNLRGGYLPYLSNDFNKLGYQINRLDERNPMKQVAIKYLNK